MHHLGNPYQPTYLGINQQVLNARDRFTPVLSHKCNVLEQLLGIFEFETVGGTKRIHVLKPSSKNYRYPLDYNEVHRVRSDGYVLPNQLIVEESNHFLLCTTQRKTLAYMTKGVDIRIGLSWTSAEDLSEFTWKRIGQLPFNFVSTAPLFSSQLQNCSRPSQQFFPEMHLPLCGDTIGRTDGHGTELLEKNMEEQYLLDTIKRFCFGRPNLLKKVIQWGLKTDIMTTTRLEINYSMVDTLAEGRVWISCCFSSAFLGSGKKHSVAQDALDNVKGAYQEVSKGVYIQPKPRANEPGIQHRLLRQRNLWIIEEYDPVVDAWNLRIQQLSRRRWRDVQSYQLIQVKVISLKKILERMVGETFEEDIEKQMKFLFFTCNQKKLNTKLKKRNIKHNIMNLKMQLKKQKHLSFAVRLVNKADEIAKELCKISRL